MKIIVFQKINKAIVLLLCFAGFACSAFGVTLKGGYVGCLSAESFDAVMAAAARKDQGMFEYYVKEKDCVMTKGGLKVSIESVSVLKGRVKVLVYVDQEIIEMWTNIENIQRYE